ncbi:MAG: Blue-light-activated protein [Syntrophorhabdus sp. PtaU1.Bin002]|nr:MAG: Blue-light-activated protein [Syntrophorhabdus sp. PtaU1.Bin002]
MSLSDNSTKSSAYSRATRDVIQGFHKDQEKLLTERVNIILLLGWTLIPLFGFLDYILYPTYFNRFLTYRFISAGCCFILYVINRKWKLGNASLYLGIIAAYIVGLAIIKMILETGGFSTPYYAGLNLVFLGMCTVLTVRVQFLAVHSIVLYLIYLTSVLAFGRIGNVAIFVANNMFVLCTMGIALVASHVGYRFRLKEYLVRTELEEAQSQLKDYSENLENLVVESEKKYQVLVDNANESIFVIQNGVIKFPNPRTTALFGHSVEELENMPFIGLVHDDDKIAVTEQKEHVEKEGGVTVSTSTFRIMRHAGETIWADMNAVSIEWGGRPAFLVFLRDITEKKRMEAELIQAQKMEAIGTLAGGIAHDFNNLLMGVIGYTSLMLLDKDEADPHYHKLKSIEKLVQSGADLTKQLLGFARGGKYEVKPTDLNELIGKSSEMFGRTKQEITMHRKYEKGLHPADIDRGQIEQVLLNLYVNAWQAMPGGGDLYLETKNVVLDAAYTKPHSLSPGPYVKISVTDTGTGMDLATQQRIFEPFFTTKEMGRGTGLGLASAYGIIKNHGGIISVESEPGKGSTFSIYLPASQGQVEIENLQPSEIVRSTETVLLVDDQEMILAVGGEMLKVLGYEVFAAQGGEEALAIYREKGEMIDVVILDMIMPAVSGGETYDRLKAINPGVKVILSSGYSIDGQATEIMARGCSGFIQKPFNIGDLSEKIREVLGRPVKE